MICPYNNFKQCNWETCAARMYVKDPANSAYLMRVCAIAYNGGSIPAQLTINNANTPPTPEIQYVQR